MNIYIRKRTVHLVLVLLLLLAASVTVVAAQQQQRIKQQAADKTGYLEPPMFGCLQIGEGTNKSCSSKLLKTELHVFLRGIKADGKKVYYNDTLTAELKVTNVGDLPVKINKLIVSGHPLNAKYKVDFQPAKSNFTINPGQTEMLTGAAHKFNNPDPGGPWDIVSLMVDDNGQSVTDVQKVNVVVDTTCTALRAEDYPKATKDRLAQICEKARTTNGCDDFCTLFSKDYPKACPNNTISQGTNTGGNTIGTVNGTAGGTNGAGQAATPDECGGCPGESTCYAANTKGAGGAKAACGAGRQNGTGEACTSFRQCKTGLCDNRKCR